MDMKVYRRIVAGCPKDGSDTIFLETDDRGYILLTQGGAPYGDNYPCLRSLDPKDFTDRYGLVHTTVEQREDIDTIVIEHNLVNEAILRAQENLEHRTSFQNKLFQEAFTRVLVLTWRKILTIKNRV